jgi:hypothetical protein
MLSKVFEKLAVRVISTAIFRIGDGQISGRDLAEKMGCSENEVSLLLRGKRKMTPWWTENMGRALGLDLFALMIEFAKEQKSEEEGELYDWPTHRRPAVNDPGGGKDPPRGATESETGTRKTRP